MHMQELPDGKMSVLFLVLKIMLYQHRKFQQLPQLRIGEEENRQE